jgi:hypothetical protein
LVSRISSISLFIFISRDLILSSSYPSIHCSSSTKKREKKHFIHSDLYISSKNGDNFSICDYHLYTIHP